MKSIDWKRYSLELIVVFLGVTSGFILNNWRDAQKDKKLERKYIESFVQNIDGNIDELNRIIKDDSLWFAGMRPKFIQMSGDSLPSDSLASVVRNILMASKITFVTSTFEDIKFSGNLNLIRNYEIKEEIVEYHDDIEGAKFIDRYYNSYFSDFVLPYIIKNYDLANNCFFAFDKQASTQLFNITAGYYSMRQQRRDNNQLLLDKSASLRKNLMTYLEQS